MAQFVLTTYVGKTPEQSTDEKAALDAAWNEYFAIAVDTDPGVRPTSGLMTVVSDGSVNDGMNIDGLELTGIQVIEAENIDAAVEVAKTCPILTIGGSVVLHERSNG